jgi:Synaptobrevin
VDNIGDRGTRLDTLQAKTDALSESALHFNNKARDTRKSMIWKNMKMRICIIVGIIILLIVIIVPSGTLAPKILTSLSLTRASCRFKTYLIIITIVVVTLESGDILLSSESLGGQSKILIMMQHNPSEALYLNLL